MTPSAAEPPIGTTLAVIRARAASLAPSERRVANVCIERPAEVAWWSALDLAENASTSTATVVRACQNLGFTGFQNLRMLLMRDLGAAFNKPSNVSAAAQAGVEMVQSVFDEVAQDLGGALAPLDVAAFDAAVAALASARRILLVANGGSAPSLAAMAVRFMANGRPVEAPQDAVMQQIAARHLEAESVCLAVSASGMNGYTLHSVKAAKDAGATVIGVTSHARSKLATLSDISLVIGGGVGSWSAQGVSPTVVQLSFLIGLEIAVHTANGGSPEAAGQSLEQVVTLLDPPE